MKRWAMAICLAGLAGCAGTSDCGGDWFGIGERDGVLGAGSQAERYAARCGTVDTEKYRAGYAEGFSRRPPPGW